MQVGARAQAQGIERNGAGGQREKNCRPPFRARRRLKSDERQGEIVAAALELAREHGPDAITTHATARRMGVMQGALLRHFPDKQAVWLAVFAWVRETLGARLAEAIDGATSPLDALERSFHAHIRFVAGNPGVPRALFHELQPSESSDRTEVTAMVGGYRRRLASLFAQAKARGELAPSLGTDVAALRMYGVATWPHKVRAGPQERLVTRQLTCVNRSLRRRRKMMNHHTGEAP